MKYYIIACLYFLVFQSFAQGIRGKIFTDTNEPLPYATIYIKQLGTGTSTNQDGYYELKMRPGTYDLVYQYLGYEAITKQVVVGQGFSDINITMKTQVVELREIQVNAKAEDPAYTVMRKAISKSRYHKLQVSEYTAKIYIKGGGRVKDSPWFLRKEMAKEGIDSSTVFITESVSEVSFKQPNTIEEKVISIRTVGEDNSTSPNGYINGSFYEPKVVEAISPLSPKAFSYYKFKLEGSFMDRDYEINKIKVTPRSKGENVFTGYIYIVEDLWCIHSLNLYTYTQGFKILLKQIYAPIKEQVFMPVSHRLEAEGSIFGFDFEYKYLATVSDYNIKLNPDLKVNLVVVDEKIEKDLAAALIQEEKNDKKDENENLAKIGETLSKDPFKDKKDKKITRKELRKTLREYEKELEKLEDEPEVVENITMTIDSIAYKRDSSYWANIRPVPLSEMEKKSYVKLDSMATKEKNGDDEDDDKNKKKKKKKKRKGFQPTDVVFGDTYKIDSTVRIEYTSPLLTLNFNTVEGYNFNLPLSYRKKYDKNKKLEIAAKGRYAIAREEFTGKLNLKYTYNKKSKFGSMELEGGRFISQFNENDPIHPIVNSLSTLFWESNFMKIYEKDYLKFNHSHKIFKGMVLKYNLEWAKRYQLFNNTTDRWRESSNVYTPNAPVNAELQNTDFPSHQAYLLGVELEYQPFLKYEKRNGRKSVIDHSSPIFRLNYKKGLDVADSEVDFDRLELGIKHRVKFGVRGRLDFNLYAGSYLNNDKMYFMDYQHFAGNRTFLQTSDPVASFRLLDYYQFSTHDNYLGSHIYYQFRKFLFTQIWQMNLMGIKENILVNYLNTDASENYMEVGYSLDNIFRFMRLEVIANFEDFEYKDLGFRIGVSTNIGDLFNF